MNIKTIKVSIILSTLFISMMSVASAGQSGTEELFTKFDRDLDRQIQVTRNDVQDFLREDGINENVFDWNRDDVQYYLDHQDFVDAYSSIVGDFSKSILVIIREFENSGKQWETFGIDLSESFGDLLRGYLNGNQ